MRVLGLDPGLNITGYGLLDFYNGKTKLVEAGVIRGKDRKSVTCRVVDIYTGVCEVIEACKPEIIAVEQLYSHYARPQTAILMGHARGVICLAAGMAGLDVKHYAATQVKKILTGNGRAPKEQMQQAIARELGLKNIPEPADVADALSIALCHCYLAKQAAWANDSVMN